MTFLPARDVAGIALFGVGGGGDPERHQPLLVQLAARGLTVIAPHFDRLAGPRATRAELLLRARRLRLALAAGQRPDLPVCGIGHSIGAATLLGLAGGQMWLDAGGPLPIDCEPALARLALLAPPTGFFGAPGALAAVDVPVLAIAASLDTVTPPAQAEFLRDALAGRTTFALRIISGAGHFSFMHRPPPNVSDPLAERNRFLDMLANDLADFALQA